MSQLSVGLRGGEAPQAQRTRTPSQTQAHGGGGPGLQLCFHKDNHLRECTCVRARVAAYKDTRFICEVGVLIWDIVTLFRGSDWVCWFPLKVRRSSGGRGSWEM